CDCGRRMRLTKSFAAELRCLPAARPWQSPDLSPCSRPQRSVSRGDIAPPTAPEGKEQPGRSGHAPRASSATAGQAQVRRKNISIPFSCSDPQVGNRGGLPVPSPASFSACAAGGGFLRVLFSLFSILLLVLQLSGSIVVSLRRRNLASDGACIRSFGQPVLALVFSQILEAGIQLFAELVVHLLQCSHFHI